MPRDPDGWRPHIIISWSLTLGILLLELVHTSRHGIGTGGAVEYKDFVSVLLTAVTIILAVLGVAIAVLAFWGYTAAQTAAKGAAKDAANAYLTDSQFALKVEEAITSKMDIARQAEMEAIAQKALATFLENEQEVVISVIQRAIATQKDRIKRPDGQEEAPNEPVPWDPTDPQHPQAG